MSLIIRLSLKIPARFYLALLFFLPTSATAMACFDFANLKQNIAGYIQEQTNFLQELEHLRSQMKLDTLIAGKKQQNDDKNTAGIIKAMSEVEVKVANRMIATKFDSLDNACDVAEENQQASDAEQAFGDKLGEVSSDETRQGIKPKTSHEQQNRSKKLIEQLAIRSDKVLAVSRFLGVGGAYKEEEVQQSQDFIDLITRKYQDRSPSNKATKDSSALVKAQRVEAISQLLRRQVVRNAFNAVRIANLPLITDASGKPLSRMEAIEQFIKTRFGSEDAINFIALATNSHPDKAENSDFNTSDTEVLRMIAIMDAFSLYLNGLKYQESVRQTQLSALMAQLMLEQADAN